MKTQSLHPVSSSRHFAMVMLILSGILMSSLLTGTAVAAKKTKTLNIPESSIPRLANGKPDFSGVWEATTAANFDLEPHANRKGEPPFAGLVEGGTIPYLPKALEQKKKNFEARETDDPALKGYTLGVPRGIYYPEPFQIFQRNNDLFIDHQFGHSVRTIYTNGTGHPEDPLDWWFGDSRGTWDGDTLVVDVKHFNDKTWFDHAGNFHSDALHIVEKWKYLDINTIDYTATIEDINVFSRPWTINVLLHRHREKNFQIIEDYRFTLDYDQYYPPKPDTK